MNNLKHYWNIDITHRCGLHYHHEHSINGCSNSYDPLDLYVKLTCHLNIISNRVYITQVLHETFI